MLDRYSTLSADERAEVDELRDEPVRTQLVFDTEWTPDRMRSPTQRGSLGKQR